MSEISVTKENVWQYYEKVSDYQAKCRFCRNEYTYIYINFRKHIGKHPRIIEYEEYKGRQEWPWICFKYNDTSTSQCLFCCENIRSDFQFLANHLKQKHFNEVESYVLYDWTWKYFAKVNDFKIECTVCFYDESIFLSGSIKKHIVCKHLEELKNAQETRNIALSLETVRDLKIMEIKENTWEYYTKVTYFHVKCKFQNCTYQIHNYSLRLYAHVKQEHEVICKWEEDHINEKWPWTYFRYSYEYIFDQSILFSECFFCGEFFPADKISTTTHLSDKHSATEIHNFTDNWIKKYVIQSTDTKKFKCTICCKNLTIDISEMCYHTIISHPEELQSIISRKSTQKLWQNYRNLRNFQVQCQHCDFQYCYINTTNFIEHVKKEHIDEYNYEQTNGKNWPFKFFNYINSTTVQCRLCILLHSLDKDKLIDHLYLHFPELLDHFIDYGWIWKYCTKVGDFEVECFCKRRISLDVSLWYFDHHIAATHPNRLPSTQRTHDIAESSGSQPN